MRVSILTTALFDLYGKDYVLGGNERYLLDVIDIYKDMGFNEIKVFQPSLKGFERTDSSVGLSVTGIEFEKVNRNAYKKMNTLFYEKSNYSNINHYQSFTMGYPKIKENSIGISHGVSWDKPIGSNWDAKYNNTEKIKRYIKNRILLTEYKKSAVNMKSLVANDTNFINFARIQWPEVANRINYIPNYVDLNKFTQKFVNNANSELTILFPRRISSERGFDITYEVAVSLLKENRQLKFIFTGKKPKTIESENKDICFSETDFEDMPTLYGKADIVIIPTIHSEGTSLSCLEAMASGVPVIATNVGGLTNLIIDHFNGILINPNPKELKTALELLIKEEGLRKKIANNALLTVKEFSKNRWVKAWEETISNVIEGTEL